MRNRYEFNIEDINNVIIATINGLKYTTTYNRKYVDNKPTELFIETYSANDDFDYDNKVASVLCPRCGAWREVPINNLDESCKECTSDYEDTVHEDVLRETILTFMDEDTFKEVMIFINGTHIK